MSKFRNTKVYSVSVQFINEVKSNGDDICVECLEFTVFADSYKNVEKMVKKEVGKHLVKIEGIYETDTIALF